MHTVMIIFTSDEA